MSISLKWTQILITIQKYMNLFIASIFIAAGVMNVGAKVGLPSWVLLAMGLVFLGVGISLGILQTGLAAGRRWSRRVAISLAVFGLISLFFPLAIMSVIELFRKETKVAFALRTEEPVEKLSLKAQVNRFLSAQSVAAYFLVGMILLLSAANYLNERDQAPAFKIKATQSGR